MHGVPERGAAPLMSYAHSPLQRDTHQEFPRKPVVISDLVRVDPALEAPVRQLLVQLDDPRAVLDHYVSELISGGVSAERVCLDVIAPAARRLGELWESDQASFVDVTVGLSRLQQLVHRVGDELQGSEPPQCPGTALLGVAPGDQHSLGIAMVAEFLRCDGWVVSHAPQCETADDLLDLVACESYDVLMLSAARSTPAVRFRRLIGRLRRVSRNPELAIMVGGPMFLEAPDLAQEIGADGFAQDAPGAVALARRLVGRNTDTNLSADCSPKLTLRSGGS